MGAAIRGPTVTGPELREGAPVPVFELYKEVRSSSCLIATSTAKAQARGVGFLGMAAVDGRRRALGQETPRNRQVPRAAARETWHVEVPLGTLGRR